MDSTQVEENNVPLRFRLMLSHAYFQYQAESNAIDLLHVKGYAFGTDTYRAHRQSSDIDVLIRPAHVDRFVEVLLAQGWEILTHFETGSIFEHAMTIYHPQWGLADIHRFFPGLGKDSAVAFEQLWKIRRKKNIASYPCDLPSVLDSQIIVLIHAGRSEAAVHPDVEFIQSQLTDEDWSAIKERVQELDAGIAFAAAFKDLEAYKGDPEYLLWKSVSDTTPDYIQWRGRLKLARGIKAKIRVLYKIFTVNRDHLAMELGHTPSRQEVRRKFFSRFTFGKKK